MSKTRTSQPLPGQMELTMDYGQQRALLRRVRVGNPVRQLMLWVIDSHIPKGRNSWRMTMRDLADECFVEYQTAYKAAAELEELGVIRRDRLGGGAIDFSICWGVLCALDEEAGEERIDTETILPVENPILRTENPVLRRENQILRTENEILPTENRTIYDTNTLTSTTSSTAEQELVMMVAGCGVGRAGAAVAAAISQGMTPGQIRAVVEHFRAPDNAGRWSPGILYDRLTRIGAHATPADQGWFGDSNTWKARKSGQAAQDPLKARLARLEAAHGPRLDGLSDDELHGLLDFMPRQTRDRLRRLMDAGYARSRSCREDLLEAMACSLAVAHPP
jgi:hypothetical protein